MPTDKLVETHERNIVLSVLTPKKTKVPNPRCCSIVGVTLKYPHLRGLRSSDEYRERAHLTDYEIVHLQAQISTTSHA